MALSALTHGGGDSGLAVTTRLSSCSCFGLSVCHSVNPEFVVLYLHCTQEKASSPLKLLGDIWKGFS